MDSFVDKKLIVRERKTEREKRQRSLNVYPHLTDSNILLNKIHIIFNEFFYLPETISEKRDHNSFIRYWVQHVAHYYVLLSPPFDMFTLYCKKSKKQLITKNCSIYAATNQLWCYLLCTFDYQGVIVVQHLFNYNFENIDNENETRQKSHFFPFRITVIVSENVETFVTQITVNFRCFFFHPEAPIKIFTNWSIFYLVCMFNNLFCWYIVSSTSFNLHQIRDEKQKKKLYRKT